MPVEHLSASAGSEPNTMRQEEIRIPLHQEEVVVSRLKREQAVVRVATQTRSREQQVDAELAHERVEIERVPFGHVVDAVPPVREEGDVTVMPVVEEILVVERKLVLKEEVRIRRIRSTERYHETVTLREQEAVVTRTPIEAPGHGVAAPPSATETITKP